MPSATRLPEQLVSPATLGNCIRAHPRAGPQSRTPGRPRHPAASREREGDGPVALHRTPQMSACALRRATSHRSASPIGALPPHSGC